MRVSAAAAGPLAAIKAGLSSQASTKLGEQAFERIWRAGGRIENGTAARCATGEVVRAIGIDPGLTRTGYAVVDRNGGRLVCRVHGVVVTPSDEPPARRLAYLRESLAGVIAEHAPEVAAVERLFFNSNVKTAVAVGQASGVALATAAEHGLEVACYTPTDVKQSVVGFGGATKRQIAEMVTSLLKLASPPRPPDAADACALAICHLNRSGLASAIQKAMA